ncbi:hypothetical protein LSTR_LSTR014661 [Laodelphax striatellus]|uniref:PHD-type domain-containing protein n=1 Tax=Laodelphax striatellus TaxID=195883 RepID=A0A482XT60_LAOST|nr:hypothetical protein LSTR_LSTR014661 [Laodelphax striatellus]
MSACGCDKLVCGHCNKSIKSDDGAIMCDVFCDRWFHSKCVNISSSDLGKIGELGDLSRWFCPNCNLRLEKLREYKIDGSSLVDFNCKFSQISEKLRVVDQDNVKLHSKLDSIVALLMNIESKSTQLHLFDDTGNVLVERDTDCSISNLNLTVDSNLNRQDCDTDDTDRSTRRKKSIVTIDLADYTQSTSINTSRLVKQNSGISAIEVRDCNSQKHKQSVTDVEDIIGNYSSSFPPLTSSNKSIINNAGESNNWSTVVRKKGRKPKRATNEIKEQSSAPSKLPNNANIVRNKNVITGNMVEVGDKRSRRNNIIHGSMKASEGVSCAF